jgi:hypothetical protein
VCSCKCVVYNDVGNGVVYNGVGKYATVLLSVFNDAGKCAAVSVLCITMLVIVWCTTMLGTTVLVSVQRCC